MDENANSGKSFKNLSKNLLGKLLKTHYFRMFSKNLIKHAFVFRAFGLKTQFVGRFWENFENFPKKIANMHYFCIFFKKLTNHSLIFCSFGRNTQFLGNFEKILKICDENSIEKLNFYFIFILETLLIKIEPSEITPFFCNIFSVSGGGVAPSPVATPLLGTRP